MIVTIEVIRDGVFNLLSDMERLGLIRLNASTKNDSLQEKKLSEQFAGALCLSDTTYEVFQKSLREGRNEWTRDIY